MYAVIDPNWGEPKVIHQTISDSEQGSISLAENLEEISIYSAAIFSTVPHKPGQWEKLKEYGFAVKKITINILES